MEMKKISTEGTQTSLWQLREMLFQALRDVQNDQISDKKAASICRLSDEIIKTIKTELNYGRIRLKALESKPKVQNLQTRIE